MPTLSFITTALDSANVQAFLHMIRCCEGTSAPDGYNYLFGSSPGNTRRFTDMSKHPDIKEPFGNTYSDAAGAYQIMYNTWTQDIQPHLSLPDFSPHSQDIAACYLISERDCLQKVIDGDFDDAITGCNTVWASLPGSPYGQPTHDIAAVTQFYTDAGGSVV